MSIIYLAAGAVVLGLLVFSLFLAVIWRRVVPTNMVHIVQSSKKTVSYGRGRAEGNTYYAVPSFIPLFGVTVTQFPESVFDLNLQNYDAYDVDRLPFLVDIRAFFRISDSQVAAQRVGNFQELQGQLGGVLQGAVRSVLAQYNLDHIMSDRANLGKEFSKMVDEGLKEWGVSTIKTIEFMDIRDARDSQVIHNIMAKKQSFIEMESRVEVAKNMQEAESKEIEAQRQISLSKAEAEQQVGIRNAERDKTIGIAEEKSKQEVQAENKLTTEKIMETQKVQHVKTAEIQRDVSVVNAEAEQKVKIVQAQTERETAIQIAEGKLQATIKDSEGIAALGNAKAESEKAMLLAPVNAQITLANEIGANEGYQAYLIEVRKVEATEAVGKEMAGAIKAADLKIIANSGTVQGGMSGLADIFTPNGGTSLAGMLEALNQTEAGKAIVDGVTSKLGNKPKRTA